MEQEFRIAAVQMVSSPLLEENLRTAKRLVLQAAQDGAELVALPEYFCFLGGTDADKLAIAEDAGHGKIQTFLAELAARCGIWLCGGTVPLRSLDAKRVFNSQLVYSPSGEQVARYDKIHLFNFSNGAESYDEAISAMPGESLAWFDCPFGRVGLSVCYDLRFPELYRALSPVDLILVPSAFTATTGRAHWETLLRARAIENQAYVLAPAQGGVHFSGRRTWGHTLLADPWGDVVLSLELGEGLLVATVNRNRIDEVRQSLPALQHRVIGMKLKDELN
jgi:deaminated glutathione amidase